MLFTRVLAGLAVVLLTTAVNADVTIASAISLKSALEKAQPLLENAAGEKVVFTFGGSGTLAGQIRQGAPVDLFLSADRATAEKLAADKTADPATLRVFAGNALVLVVPAKPDDATHSPASFAQVAKARKLAIGDPQAVPAGAYAKQVLDHLKLWDPLAKANQLVTTEDVAQALTLVRRGEVDAAIVYATDAKNQPAVRLVATADPAWYTPIEYVSVIIRDSPHKPAALNVQQALATPEVQAILHDFGFTPPPPPATATRPVSK
jgi:molybdate transport system substrate-binding protein